MQGGSSFNALVKALRQQASDLEAEGGSARRGLLSPKKFDRVQL